MQEQTTTPEPVRVSHRPLGTGPPRTPGLDLTPKSPPELDDEIERAGRSLATLEEEASSLPEKLQQATIDGDAKTVIGLRRRKGEIKDFIYAARAQLLGLRIEREEARLESLGPIRERVQAMINAVQARVTDAERDQLRLEGSFSILQSQHEMIANLRERLKDQLDEVLGEASH